MVTSCSGSDDSASADSSGPPPAPKLGELMDRAGRPGIAEALVEPFASAADHDQAVAGSLPML